MATPPDYVETAGALNDLYNIDATPPDVTDLRFQAAQRAGVPMSAMEGVNPAALKSMAQHPDLWGFTSDAPITAGILKANPYAFSAARDNLPELAWYEKAFNDYKQSFQTAKAFGGQALAAVHQGILDAASGFAAVGELPAKAEDFVGEKLGFGDTLKYLPLTGPTGSLSAADLSTASQKAETALTGPGGAEQYLQLSAPLVYGDHSQDYGAIGSAVLRTLRVAPSIAPALIPGVGEAAFIGEGLGQGVQQADAAHASAGQALLASVLYAALYGTVGKFGLGRLASGVVDSAVGESTAAKIAAGAISRTTGGVVGAAGFTVGSNAITKIFDPSTPLLQGLGQNMLVGIGLAHGMHAVGVTLAKASDGYVARSEAAATQQSTYIEKIFTRMAQKKLSKIQQAIVSKAAADPSIGTKYTYIPKDAFSQLSPDTQAKLGAMAPVDVGDRLRFDTVQLGHAIPDSEMQFFSRNVSFHSDGKTADEMSKDAEAVRARFADTVPEVAKRVEDQQVADSLTNHITSQLSESTPYTPKQAAAISEGLIIPFYRRVADAYGVSMDALQKSMPFRILTTTEFDPQVTLPAGEGRYDPQGNPVPAQIEAQGFDPGMTARVLNVQGGVAHVTNDPQNAMGISDAHVKAENPLEIDAPKANTKAGLVNAIQDALSPEDFHKAAPGMARAKTTGKVLEALQEATGHDALYVKGTQEAYLPNREANLYPTRAPMPKIASEAKVSDPGRLKGAYREGSILLTPNADPATFLHELGHFFVDQLSKMAAHPDAPPEFKTLVNELLQSAGGPDAETFVKQSVDEQRPVHEGIVESFLYTIESDALRPREVTAAQSKAYDTLAALVGDFAQRGIADNPDISPETGTMLAAIWNGQQRVNENADSPIITPEVAQTAHIRDGVAGTVADVSKNAVDDANLKVVHRVIKHLRSVGIRVDKAKAGLQRTVDATIKQYQEQNLAELKNDPVWVHAQEFSRSTLVGKEQRVQAIPKSVIDEVGASQLYEDLKKAGLAKAGKASKKATPDITADQLIDMAKMSSPPGDAEYSPFGFLKAMLDAKQKDEKWIHARAVHQAIVLHTDLFDDRANEDETLAALSNPTRSRFYRIEMNALNEAAGLGRVERKALRSFAAKSFSNFNFREAQHAGAFARAREQARANVRAALKQSDLHEAAREARNVVLLDHYERMALDLKKQNAAFHKRMQQMATQKGMAGLSGNVARKLSDWAKAYTGATARSEAARDTVMESTQSPLDIEALKEASTALTEESMRAFKQNDAAETKDIRPMDALLRVPDEHWTVKDFRALKEAVDFARTQARNENSIRLAGKTSLLDDGTPHLVDVVKTANPGKKYTAGVAIVESKEHAHLPSWFKEVSAPERSIADGIHTLLGTVRKGVKGVLEHTDNILWQSWHEALNAQAQLDIDTMRVSNEYLKPVRNQYGFNEYRKYSNDVHPVQSDSPQLENGITRKMATVLTLHWGSAEGRDRIAHWFFSDDYDRGDKALAYSKAFQTMKAIWDIMDDRDFQMAQAHWDANEQVIKPVYAGMYRRVVGYPMTEVDAVPFTVERPGGKSIRMSGGYAHLSYDTQHSGKYPDLSSQILASRKGMNLGAGRERVQTGLSTAMPLNLNLEDVQRDMINALNTGHLNEPLTMFNKIIRHPDVRAAIESVLGKERYAQMTKRADTLLNPPVNASVIGKAMVKAQTRLSATTLGLQYVTAFLNTTALAPPFAEATIPKSTMVHALLTVSAHPFDVNTHIDSMSKMMSTRVHSQPFMMHGAESFSRTIADRTATYMMLNGVDKYTANVTWLAGYNAEYARSQNQVKAVAFADDMVIKWHAGVREIDVGMANSRFDQMARIFKWMMPYFIRQRLTLINQYGDAKKLWDDGQHAQAAALAVAHTIYAMVLPGLLSAVAYSPCSMEDNPVKCGVENVGLYGSMYSVWTRIGAQMAINLGEGRDASPRSLTSIGTGVQYIGGTAQGAMRLAEGKKVTIGQQRSFFYLLGAATGLPLGVIGRSIAYWHKLHDQNGGHQ